MVKVLAIGITSTHDLTVAKNGVLERIFAAVYIHRLRNLITIIKVHPDTGALKKTDHNLSGSRKVGGQLKIDDKTALTFSLSPGNSHDAPEGRLLLEDWDNKPEGVSHLAMDKAYEGDETRQLVINFGWIR